MQLNFVLCPSYHGATLLALLLNNHPNISSLGDTVPSPDFIQRCSCAKSVMDCPFWSDMRDQLAHLPPAPGTPEHIGPLPLFRPTLGTRAAALLGIALSGRLPAWTAPNSHDWMRRYLAFREAVIQKHSTTIFVDGEKSVTRVMLLKGLLGKQADIRVLHLTRDPRGFFNSCKKHLPNANAKTVARMWMHHKKISLFNKRLLPAAYLRIRYEDLCGKPEKTMGMIFNFFGAAPRDVLHAPSPIKKFHLMGNKMVQNFDGKIRLDTGWRDSLSPEEQENILGLTAPLCRDYGYLNAGTNQKA